MKRYIKTGIFSFVCVSGLSAADPAPQDATAQYNMGIRYYKGEGVPEDMAKAFNLFREAARLGNAHALAALREAAERGNATAQYNLGMMYYEGKGVSKDEAKAFFYFGRAAYGNTDAMNWLRKAAEQGNAIAVSRLEAIANDKYRGAMDTAVGTSQNILGMMYYEGKGVPKDEAKAFDWFSEAAKYGGNTDAMNWLRKASEQGNAIAISRIEYIADCLSGCNSIEHTAKNILGMMYYEGKGVPKDEVKAFNWFSSANTYKDDVTASYLGMMYYEGKGVPKDEVKSVEFFSLAAELGNADALAALRKIAEQGNATAQYKLGMLYYEGKGVPKDGAEAVNWLSKAADQGEAKAQETLGMMYFKGDGVPKDYDKAMALLCKIDSAVAQEPAASDIVIKKMFIGMSIVDACKIAYTMEPLWTDMKQPSRIEKNDGGSYIFTVLNFYVHADQYGQVDKVFFDGKLTNSLFNTADMQPDAFAQEIANNYGIPSLEPFVETNLFASVSGWEFSSPQGTKIRVFNSKAIKLERIPKQPERKFD